MEGFAHAGKRWRFHRVVGRAAGGARWKIYHQVLLRGRLALRDGERGGRKWCSVGFESRARLPRLDAG